MSAFIENDHFYDEPIRLSEEERERPISVILEVFTKVSLSEIRQFLADVSETCLTTDIGPFRLAEQRSKLLSYLMDIERVFEACKLLAKDGAFDQYVGYE